jgi:hypothetical protein
MERTCPLCGYFGGRRFVRGICNACYLFHLRRGTIDEAMPLPPKDARLRLWLASMEGQPGCWPWPHYIDQNGYAMTSVSWKRGNMTTSRAVWILTYGMISDDIEMDHLCHTQDPRCDGGRACLHRRCARLDHLEPVTPLVNSRRRESRKLLL